MTGKNFQGKKWPSIRVGTIADQYKGPEMEETRDTSPRKKSRNGRDHGKKKQHKASFSFRTWAGKASFQAQEKRPQYGLRPLKSKKTSKGKKRLLSHFVGKRRISVLSLTGEAQTIGEKSGKSGRNTRGQGA